MPLVPLVTFDERTRKLLVYNDSVSETTGELEYLDFLEGQVTRKPSAFVTRHGFAELGLSETTATSVLREEPGTIPNNLPERRRGHVRRPHLEAEIDKVGCDDKHRILSLDGRGGVGKTYLATEVCHRIVRNAAAQDRFGFVMWMSARDVDLTAAGPKPVRQDLVTIDDVLRFVIRAHDPQAAAALQGEALKAAFVETCKVLHPLLVLDNFETFEQPEALLRLIDDLVPNPAKVLITSRHRYFRGDFPIPVGAMSEDEGRELILAEAGARFVRAQFESSDRVRRVYEVAQGHAYTMRLIVAQVGEGQSVHDACTAVEKSTDVLSALFERTLRLVEPADAELASVLAAYRGECPLEALLLLPLPRQDVEDAVGRLFNLSLLERIEEPLLRLPQYVCPRAAGEYIRRKGLLESPEVRAKLDGVATTLRAATQIIKTMARRVSGGVRTEVQAADAMLDVAELALDRKETGMARRAVDVALGFAGEDARILSAAAELLRRTGSTETDVDGMFERALQIDPLNAQSWLQWGRFKAQSNTQAGQVMACFERALEADPDSREALVEFVNGVLEVLRQEKRLGFGAVRPKGDRRPARTLLRTAEEALDRHLLGRDAGSERARLLTLKGWVALQLRGVGPALWNVAREAEKLAPASAHTRNLIETMKRIEHSPKKGSGADE